MKSLGFVFLVIGLSFIGGPARAAPLPGEGDISSGQCSDKELFLTWTASRDPQGPVDLQVTAAYLKGADGKRIDLTLGADAQGLAQYTAPAYGITITRADGPNAIQNGYYGMYVYDYSKPIHQSGLCMIRHI